MKSIGVFCGSAGAVDARYLALAREVGRSIASSGWGLTYGGSVGGMMGEVADGALAAGGFVLGIVPKCFSQPETVHPRLSRLICVESLAERKLSLMREPAAFVILPGGYGTADELFELMTLTLIGEFTKPALLLNWEGFYEPLVRWMEQIERLRFGVRPEAFQVGSSLAEVGEFLRVHA